MVKVQLILSDGLLRAKRSGLKGKGRIQGSVHLSNEGFMDLNTIIVVNATSM